MRQIFPPFYLARKVLGEQKRNEGIPCRMTVHCMCVERPEGVLLYHTLTGELLLLSREEAAALKTLPGPVAPTLAALVPKWFLRPEGSDDMALADQVRQIGERFRKKEPVLTQYTIFTTMACNARCFYCYEAGIKKVVMTEQIARDAAGFIAAHCNGKPVHIRWFGGEPLVNAKAIDVITDSLREQEVGFHSTMTSNGYLFDEALVRRAKDAWNLKLVQITLDGTEEVYNQRKAYVHPEGSPFRRVLGNIGLLLDAGVPVKVRLNMDEGNERDLYVLVDQLAERFGGKPGFGVYSTVLFENAGFAPRSYTEKERCSYAHKLQALRAYIEEKNITAREALNRGFVVNACKVDSGSFTTLTPEGQLGICEGCKDSDIWGSIYSNERNDQVLCQWRERIPPQEVCTDCAVYPQCVRLRKCPSCGEYCSPLERSFREDKLRRAVLWAYEDQKAADQG